MHPNVWGRHFWFTIHFAALGYPEEPGAEDRRHYKDFYENLHHILPCGKCAMHYRQHLAKHPIDVSSRQALFAWTVTIHNAVNAKGGKPIWTLDRATAYYERLIASRSHGDAVQGFDLLQSGAFWKGIVMTALLALIVYLIWFLSRQPPTKPVSKRKDP